MYRELHDRGAEAEDKREQEPEDSLLTIHQAAAALNVSYHKMRRLILDRGDVYNFSSKRYGMWRIPASVVERIKSERINRPKADDVDYEFQHRLMVVRAGFARSMQAEDKKPRKKKT